MDTEGRNRERDEDHGRECEKEPRPSRDPPRKVVPAALTAARGVAQEGNREPVDAPSDQHQQRRQERNGDEHLDEHDERRCETEIGQQRNPDREQAEQGDDHDRAGERNRASCSRDGRARRLARFDALGELFAEAGDHEQCVIDPNADPEHRSERGRNGGDVQEGGRNDDAGRPDAQSNQGGSDRHTSRKDRPEADD